ncbi:MAG: alanine racemase [Acidimicrobiales bacterium]|nr:alanine racemase [Acidimicrobiales bacterium]
MRPTLAEIDLEAVAHNVAALAEFAAPAELCAVVKADGYTHGAVPVARAALRAGATWLAVALVDEGLELRAAGIDCPILVLSEPRPHEMGEVAHHGLRPTLYSGEGLAAMAAAAAQHGSEALPVHVKVDTGMHRVGIDPSELLPFVRALHAKPELFFEGLWTHSAVADEPDNEYTAIQLDRFAECVRTLEAADLRPPMIHAANSALTLSKPDAHFDLVRCGIEVYGVPPSDAMPIPIELRPAIKLKSEVSFAKWVRAGERVSYGLRWEAPEDRWVVTVPIGYADGVQRRSYECGVEVLIGGRRRPIVGAVTMDQLMVDCGTDSDITPGAEVVLIGRQGDDEITPNEIAARLGTIGYEVICAISSRVRRHYR